MKQIFGLVAILVTVGGFTQAAPLLSMSEKEDLLRELVQNKRFFDWFWGSDEETTTQPLPTTKEPEPVQINVAYGEGEGTSGLTSAQICGIAQSLYPRSETVASKRDLVLNMIYHVCLPSVGRDDLEAIGLIMAFLSQQEQQDFNEPLVPTTPEPEPEEEEDTLSPEWQALLEHLAQAQDKPEETGETAEEATTPAAASENAGSENAGAENAGGADETGASADAGVDAGAGAEAAGDAEANADTDAKADTAAGADGSTNVEANPVTDVSPVKRLEDVEILRLLLKAVELNSKN